MHFEYGELFGRNYGILTSEQQERIKKTRIVIFGDSGTGEILATLLARSGFTDFIIAGRDVYEPSDMNRQIGCFIDTLGRRKTDVIRDTLLSINPGIRITIHRVLPAEDEIDQLVAAGDIIIPAVDDLSYSVLLFRAARKFGIPAILCVPSGTAGWVSVFTAESPTLEDMFGIPKLDYPGLVSVMRSREYRCAQYNYVIDGDWRIKWFFDYYTGQRPLALICPVEWMAASLASLEAMKIASDRWEPMIAPRCWILKKGRVSASRFSLFVRTHRKLGWALFGTDRGIRLHKLTHAIWKRFFDYLRYRESGSALKK